MRVTEVLMAQVGKVEIIVSKLDGYARVRAVNCRTIGIRANRRLSLHTCYVQFLVDIPYFWLGERHVVCSDWDGCWASTTSFLPLMLLLSSSAIA